MTDWKVGDRLVATRKATNYAYIEGSIHTIVEINAEKMKLECGSVWDFRAMHPITSYWFLMPTTPYAKGDRVRRTNEPGGVPMGTTGTVESVQGDTLHILWDNGRTDTYGPALYHFLEPYLDTTPKPVLACERCNESNQWAEANQPNGAYRCYQCRYDRFR